MKCSDERLNGCPDKMALDQFSFTLDRVSPVPLYFQVEQALAQEISSGRIAIGTRLPTEPELAEQFGVSRSVIRQALTRLEQTGLVARRRGIGSFVAQKEPPSWQLQGSRGFFEDEVGRLGREVVSTVLRAEAVVLPPWAAAALRLEDGTRGVVLERLRYVDNLLTMYDLNYLPEEFADAVVSLRAVAKHSLYETLRRAHGVTVATGRRTIDAVRAGSEFAELLEVDEDAPLLFVEGVDLDAAFRPFDCYRTWLRPDRLKIQVDVVSADTSSVSAVARTAVVQDEGGFA